MTDCLDVAARLTFQHQRSQAPKPECARVDADAMRPMLDRFENRVAVDDHLLERRIVAEESSSDPCNKTPVPAP